MQSFVYDKLIKISKEDLGAIDDTVGYVCRPDGDTPINKVLSGAHNWLWKTVPAREAEDDIPCMMFVKHVDNNPILTAILKKLNLRVNNVASLGNGLNFAKEIQVGIAGMLIDTKVFIRERFKTIESIKDFATHEDIQVQRGLKLMDDFCLKGKFDLTLCSYYCDFGE